MHIALVGMMASGKTKVGRRVADALGRPYVDNDELLEERTGKSPGQVEEQDGLPALHTLERTLLHESLAAAEPAVVGVAASTVEDPACREALARDAFNVWLALPPEEIARKVAASDRPRQGDDIAALARAREPLYREIADLVVDRADTTAEEAARLITEAFAARSP